MLPRAEYIDTIALSIYSDGLNDAGIFAGIRTDKDNEPCSVYYKERYQDIIKFFGKDSVEEHGLQIISLHQEDRS